jgi:hypothetical protein
VVGEGAKAKKLLDREKPRFHRRRETYYLKPSEVRRRQKNNAKLVARREAYWWRVEQGIEPSPSRSV